VEECVTVVIAHDPVHGMWNYRSPDRSVAGALAYLAIGMIRVYSPEWLAFHWRASVHSGSLRQTNK
jgi:hypothetical protein